MLEVLVKLNRFGKVGHDAVDAHFVVTCLAHLFDDILVLTLALASQRAKNSDP